MSLVVDFNRIVFLPFAVAIATLTGCAADSRYPSGTPNAVLRSVITRDTLPAREAAARSTAGSINRVVEDVVGGVVGGISPDSRYNKNPRTPYQAPFLTPPQRAPE